MFKRTLLSVTITASFAHTVIAAEQAVCDPTTTCKTVVLEKGSNKYGSKDINVSNGDGVLLVSGEWKTTGIKHNVKVTGEDANAIHIKESANFKGNLYIEKGVDIISENGTAIMVAGDFNSVNQSNPNLGIHIKDGSTVSGHTAAIDFSQSKKTARLDMHGTVIGDIIGNGLAGNKMNLGYQGSAGKSFVFDGDKIVGIGKIDNLGNLTIITRDDKPVFFDGNFTNMKNGSIDFHISGDNTLEHSLLLVDGKVDFKQGSTVHFSYKGSNINNLLGKEIVLIEASQGIVGGQEVSVTGDVFNLSPLLAADDSWLEKLPPEVNGGVVGDKLVASYDVNYAGGDAFVANTNKGGGSKQEKSVAKYIVDYALEEHNKTKSEESGELLALLTSAGNSSDATAKLVDEITPDAEGAEIHAALQATDKMRSSANKRSETLRYNSRSGNGYEGWNVTPNFVGGYGSSSSSDGIKGYDLSTYGVTVEADRLVGDDKFLGLSAGYIGNNADIEGTSNSKTINGYHLMGYIGWIGEQAFIDSNVNIGYSTVESKRKVGAVTGFEGIQNSEMSYGMFQLGYQLTSGYTFDVYGINVEPFASYKHNWIRVEDRQETGSIASLQYDRETYSVGYLGAGVNVYNTYELPQGSFTPSASFSMYYDTNKKKHIVDEFGLAIDKGSNPLNRNVIVGAQTGGDIIEARFGAELEIQNGLSIDGNVAWYQRDSFNEGSFGISLTKSF